MLTRKGIDHQYSSGYTNSLNNSISDQRLAPRVHAIHLLPPVPIQRVIGRDKLHLACVASGNPVPKIEWSKDGILFREGTPTYGNAQGKIRHILAGEIIIMFYVSLDETWLVTM